MNAEGNPIAETIIIRAPAGTKARWVKSAHPGKLSAWVCKMIDEPPNADRYLARFAPHQGHAVNEDQFSALAKLLGLHTGPAQEGARLVLCYNMPIGRAAELAGCSRQSVGNTVNRCRRALELARQAIGQT